MFASLVLGNLYVHLVGGPLCRRLGVVPPNAVLWQGRGAYIIEKGLRDFAISTRDVNVDRFLRWLRFTKAVFVAGAVLFFTAFAVGILMQELS
jgi:hypothetical protein